MDYQQEEEKKIVSLFKNKLKHILKCVEGHPTFDNEPMVKFFLDERIDMELTMSFVKNVLSKKQRKMIRLIITDYFIRHHYHEKYQKEEIDDDNNNNKASIASRLKNVVRKRDLKRMYRLSLHALFNNQDKQEIKYSPISMFNDDEENYYSKSTIFQTSHLDYFIEHCRKKMASSLKCEYQLNINIES